MTDTTHPRESSAAALYVGVELSAGTWLLVMGPSAEARTVRREVPAGHAAAIQAALAAAKRHFGLAEAVAVRSVTRRGGTASGRTGC